MYSLGCLLYAAVTGAPPFDDDAPMMVIHQQMDELPAPLQDQNAKLSDGFCNIVMRLLEKDPNDRFESRDAILEAFADPSAVGANPLPDEKPPGSGEAEINAFRDDELNPATVKPPEPLIELAPSAREPVSDPAPAPASNPGTEPAAAAPRDALQVAIVVLLVIVAVLLAANLVK
jgi:serine/threonine protein kinase